MKQTAVEFMIERLKYRGYLLDQDIEQAKAMFEEQVTLSHINGQSEFDKGAYGEHNKKLANEYYKQTFKQK